MKKASEHLREMQNSPHHMVGMHSLGGAMRKGEHGVGKAGDVPPTPNMKASTDPMPKHEKDGAL